MYKDECGQEMVCYPAHRRHYDPCCESHTPPYPTGHKFGQGAEFAEVYSNVAQTLSQSPGSNTAGQTAVLEKTVFATSGIDVSQAASAGKVKVNVAGWYDIATGISANLGALGSPLPVWSLSLFVNGAIVPGSTFANMTISPEQKANEVIADVFVHLNAGDVVELANTSASPINLTAPTYGTNAQTNSAYMKIILSKAD